MNFRQLTQNYSLIEESENFIETASGISAGKYPGSNKIDSHKKPQYPETK